MFLAASLEKVSARIWDEVDVFLFDHVRELGGDGRGLASACEDQVGRAGCVLKRAEGGFRHRWESLTKYTLPFYF